MRVFSKHHLLKAVHIELNSSKLLNILVCSPYRVHLIKIVFDDILANSALPF